MKRKFFQFPFKELRSFLLLWSSQTVSELGTAMTNYALIIWAYGQVGTASSITILTICSFLPTIFLRFLAGALVDRWSKKGILLISDLIAACGTGTILLLYSCASLQVWHLYLINSLLSLMNAFQSPAAFVATSLVVPKEHYTRTGGLQSFSSSAISILAPALGSCLLAFGGMTVVLLCDLLSFFFAFFVLLCCVRIPEPHRETVEKKEPFLKNLLEGVRYLRSHAAILHLTLFFTLVNFFAKLGNDGMISPFVLSRTGNDQQILGMVQSSVALGLLAGSLLVMTMKPVKNRIRLIFLSCAILFAGNIVQSLTLLPAVWCAVSFLSYGTAAVMNANLMTVIREQVPERVQGRVFSARDTLQNCAIPLGLFFGGILTDHVFEPFMKLSSPLQSTLSRAFGSGNGAGIALLFFLVGVLGFLLSLSRLRKSVYRELR